ncbi:tRNA (N6-isopentenyl adenosine(37)-C2)-methylthiotransferase MiaB [candidate division KSB1 bacterium 4484_87]|nr:MAG: tRNA (N6-isopentenyl adenosine(37)-C2)-methylthiotransferase MiaB [candidate division KSB1 bacterium 4484_87]
MKKVYFETYGCQMNKYDSELVAGILGQEGYLLTDKVEDSDLILINTCSVREHAEKRVFGRLDALRQLKKKNQDLVIGVMGCMAARLKDGITESRPFVNFVVSPDNYRSIPQLLQKIEQDGSDSHFTLAEFNEYEDYGELFPSHTRGVNAWVAIMRGCNNFCSYCIVPYVRGRERSRKLINVVSEVERLAQQNYKEITLLGQNVNSYHDGENDFADLILRVADVEGIERVRFATSHPKDLSDKLIEAIAAHPKICNHIHLPVQAGSDKILKAMNRRYTREHYLRLAEKARAKIDGLGLYTDIIVGFPGETDEDFQDTVDLLKEIEFDGAFIFKYSPREGTKAARLQETVSEKEKVDRLKYLNEVQDEISLKKNMRLVGKIETVLAEGPSKKAKPNQYMGRTEANKIVVFDSKTPVSNQMLDVRIIDVKGHTLFGELVGS